MSLSYIMNNSVLLNQMMRSNIVMEADDEEPDGNVGNDDIATDYTQDNDSTNEPNNQNNDDNAEDYTKDAQDNDSNDSESDTPNDDESTENDGDSDNMESGDEEQSDTATDYTTDAGVDNDNDSDSSDSSDDTGDDISNDGTPNKRHTLIKNYNLLNDFNKVYNLVDDTISTIESTIYGDVVQNKIVNQVLKNLTRIKEFILTFIRYHFNDNIYEFNLYYYETIMTSLELNLKILSKIKDIPNTEQNSKKLKKGV